ncbi:MAG: acyclic terpene utilization AtuA family protein [Polaromonas sp.]|nr:acyclic terpene utilization AtuA family protein [Polaromonas sp.]
MNKQALWVGCGTGFSGDRVDAPMPVVETLSRREGRRILILETLAERTLALAQLARREDASKGYEPLLEHLLRPILGKCLEHRIAIVSNFGAANPAGAAEKIHALARSLGLRKPRIAVVHGDDLMRHPESVSLLAGMSLGSTGALVSANAYLGADAIAGALRDGADVVVTGRVADPSLTVGPAMAHFGWGESDWNRLGAATMAGHLLECGAQVSGGYFADPGFKDVPGLAHVGFPIAQIDADGHCIVGKAECTGGLVDARTVKEQLLYELHDPAAYLTPDVVADISQATVTDFGGDRVSLQGVQGHPRPATLKVSAFYEGGWLAEGEISYAGPRAEARARLAADIIRARTGDAALRFDLVGVLSVFGDDHGALLARHANGGATDVRLRVAGKFAGREEAQALMREVNSLYTCGPAGGGGVRTSLRARLETRSCYVDRSRVTAAYDMV